MKRSSQCLCLLLLGVLAAGVFAQELDHTPEWNIELELPDHPIDVYKETATSRFAVKWKHDVDPEDWFRGKGVDLSWMYDLDDDWSVYQAESVAAANVIMRDILAVLSHNPANGPFRNPQLCEDVRDCIGAVRGNNVLVPFSEPSECDKPLPNACPAEGLWGLNYIKAPAVWNALPGVVNEKPTEAVMVIDTGVRPTHEDLVGSLQPGITVQFVGGNPSTIRDGDGHGTHVAGTIFAKWNNGKDSAVGVVGKALGGVCGCGTPRLLDDLCITRCVTFASENGVRVINLSFGGQYAARLRADDPKRRAYKRFCDAGGLAIAAAGNGNKNIIEPGNFNYPQTLAADFEGTNPKCILNVANIEKTGTLASSSDYGEYVKIAAPGTDILSAGIASDTDTATKTGTSMAAPHVSGMATLLFNAFPGISPSTVYDCIVNSAKRPVQPNPAISKPKPVNGGIADLQGAFECTRGSPTCPTTGLPPCVDPKSGTAVKTCSTKAYCRPLNAEYVCEYKFAVDGTLCRNNQTAQALFAKLAAPAKPNVAAASAVIGRRSNRPPYTTAASRAASTSDGKYDDATRESYSQRQPERKSRSRLTGRRTSDKSKPKQAYTTDDKSPSYGYDAYEYNPAHKPSYEDRMPYRGRDVEQTYGYDDDMGAPEYTHSGYMPGNQDMSYSAHPIESPQHKRHDYGYSHHSYGSYGVHHHPHACGVCRQGQCVTEVHENCKASPNAPSEDEAPMDVTGPPSTLPGGPISPAARELDARGQELYDAIMAYRRSVGLPDIPVCDQLNIVAGAHVVDLQANPPQPPCNAHSWSFQAYPTTGCCYTGASQADYRCMWDKPRQLSTYPGNGFEIAYGGPGATAITPQSAVTSWRSSPAHNDVMINTGIWNQPWAAIGVGISNNYAVAWFGREPCPP